MGDKFKLSNYDCLQHLKDKIVCSGCNKKRLYFCYDCHGYVGDVERMVPKVQLPVKVDIIKHPRERNGKSTAIHCKLLAGGDTRIFEPLHCPDYNEELKNGGNIVIVFPSKRAIPINEYVEKHGKIDKLVFLDSTWLQVGSLRNIKQLNKVPHVSMKQYKTDYWRSQHNYSDEFLATIEAIYYANKEVWQAQHIDQTYEGHLDDLLFWFYYFRSMVDDSFYPENRKKPNDKKMIDGEPTPPVPTTLPVRKNISFESGIMSSQIDNLPTIQVNTHRSLSKHNSVEGRRARLNMPLMYRMYESQSDEIRGTVSGAATPDFHPEEVAKILRKALVGITTDDKSIIHSIFCHTNYQRQQICKAYESMYQRDLITDIQEEIGGFFMDLCIALLKPTHVYSTNLLVDSFSNKAEDKMVSVEIACTTTNSQLNVIQDTYTFVTKRNLEKDLGLKVEGLFGQFLKALYYKQRDDEDFINSDTVSENLRIMTDNNNFFDEIGRSVDLFTRFFVQPSFATIREMIDTYDLKKENGKEFEALVRKTKNMHPDIRSMILLIIKISRNIQLYFADRLHEAISGSRADHFAIIRIVVMRSEIDLQDIVEEYTRKYNQSPMLWLQKTCSGDYFRLLSVMLNVGSN
uniref:tRNA-uridine aminocarboxypropyltransferase n=1 Tax=Rhabditophanes sp. KR3021 TaxID=114890 RepID=A0AC35TV91_9BILA